MDSGRTKVMDDQMDDLLKSLVGGKTSPQKTAAMIDHVQKEHDKLFSCRTCQHYTPYRATKMQAIIPKLDLCVKDPQQLKPLPKGGVGCTDHSMATTENYMGDQDEGSKGSVPKNITIKPGEVMIPVPKENMILVNVVGKEVILKTQQGKEYRFDIADWNFDKTRADTLPGKSNDKWINESRCAKGDIVQIVSVHSFNYVSKSGEWLILKDQNGKEVTIPRKDYVVHFVCTPDNVYNQRKKVEVVK